MGSGCVQHVQQTTIEPSSTVIELYTFIIISYITSDEINKFKYQLFLKTEQSMGKTRETRKLNKQLLKSISCKKKYERK